MANKVYIASRYPLATEQKRPLYGGYYKIPAVSKGEKPFILEIEDAIQWEDQPLNQPRIPRQITADQIAADIVNALTTNAPFMSEDAKPAVWVTAGPNVSEQEIAQYEAMQRAYFERLVLEADSKKPEDRKFITPLMKIAALDLGVHRDWAKLTPDELTGCPWCKTSVPIGTVVCPKCANTVDFDAFARLKAREQAALQAAMPPTPAVASPAGKQAQAQR